MQLEKQIWALEAFVNSVHVLTRAQNAEALISGVCDCITNQPTYLIAWVGLAENDSVKTVRVAGISGKAKDYAQGLEVSWDESRVSGQGPTGRTIRSGEPAVIQDTEQDPSFEPWRARAKAYGIRSSASVPIYEGKRIIGALMVYAGVPDAFTPPELRLFQGLANEIGVGLGAFEEHAKLEAERRANESAQTKLLESLELTIGAMATTMELRDPYTSGHQRQVAKISEAIAHEMGIDEKRVLGLKLAAMIHDMEGVHDFV
jgi:GAF domain-containing protein